MRVRFRCGHGATVDPDKTTSPACQTCGEKVISRVITADLPRIVGHATGPLVQTKELGAMAVNLVREGAVPLTLKDETQEQTHGQ